MINIAEILKVCPKGTKLYSPFCGECYLYCVEDDVIRVSDNGGNTYSFYKDGKQRPNGERLLFPSKENRDWSTFNHTRELKKGILYTATVLYVYLLERKDMMTMPQYCILRVYILTGLIIPDQKRMFTFNKPQMLE